MDSASAKSDATKALLARLWQRSLPLLLHRLDVLDAAADAARAQSLGSDLRAQATAEAHNLAGSLGMFGYPEGTNIARKIEVLLDSPTSSKPERLTELAKALRANLFPPN